MTEAVPPVKSREVWAQAVQLMKMRQPGNRKMHIFFMKGSLEGVKKPLQVFRSKCRVNPDVLPENFQ